MQIDTSEPKVNGFGHTELKDEPMDEESTPTSDDLSIEERDAFNEVNYLLYTFNYNPMLSFITSILIYVFLLQFSLIVSNIFILFIPFVN